MVMTAKRSLSQRIDNFLKASRRDEKGWSRWKLHNLLIAISRLEGGRYSEGECIMSEVEMGRPYEPDGYEWRSTADFAELERRLESAVQTDQQASHATRNEPEQCSAVTRDAPATPTPACNRAHEARHLGHQPASPRPDVARRISGTPTP